jgi:hypothetical protein
MADFGGLIKLRLPDGRNLSLRGSVTHMPGRMTYAKVANTDGTLDRTATFEGYEASFSYSNRQLSGAEIGIDALMELSGVTVTVMYDTEKVDRTFSGASFLGRPSVDDMTGEVTGVTLQAEAFLETRR